MLAFLLPKSHRKNAMALIPNVIKKIKEENFVQFINGQLVWKGGSIDLSGLGGGGGGGGGVSPNEIKFAYASAPDGTGFTLDSSTELEYVAFKSFAPDVTPVKNDFAGLWYHRKGLPGAPGLDASGINGEPGGIRMNLSTTTASEKPGTGLIRFNNANLALATEMYMDEAMTSGVDLSNFVNALGTGWQFMLKPNTNLNSPLAIFKITGDPTDNGDWFVIPIENQVMSSALFSNADKCVLQFFGGGGGTGTVNEEAILEAGNFLRGIPNGAGGYKIYDNTNVELKAASQVFKLPGFTITGVSNIPAANTFPHGAVVRLHQDILVGFGANPMGVFVQADAVNNIWRPWGPQVLFYGLLGSIASPTCTLSAAGKFNLGTTDPVIPGELLNSGSKLAISAKLRKVGATAPMVRMHLGTDLSARENNSIVYQQTFTATTNIDTNASPRIELLSGTTGKSTRANTVGGGGIASSAADFNTLIDIAEDMKLTIEATTLSSDTINLYDLMVVWEA